MPEPAHVIDHFVRIRAISDHISQIPHDIVFRRSCHNGLQSFEIGVNIGNDQRAHSMDFRENGFKTFSNLVPPELDEKIKARV